MCVRAESDWHKVGFSSVVLYAHILLDNPAMIDESPVVWGFGSHVANCVTMWDWSLSNIAGRSTK